MSRAGAVSFHALCAHCARSLLEAAGQAVGGLQGEQREAGGVAQRAPGHDVNLGVRVRAVIEGPAASSGRANLSQESQHLRTRLKPAGSPVLRTPAASSARMSPAFTWLTPFWTGAPALATDERWYGRKTVVC